MQFLNPKTDFAFKRIFGSSESGDILLSFLNAILDLRSPYRICQVEILDPYLAPKIKGMKDTFLDVRAQDEQGKSYIIEMQVLNVAGFEKRVLYNACKAYAGQLSKGESYQLLTDVIAITITDFVMFDDLSDTVNSFKLRAEGGTVYHDDLELVFAELPKFNKEEDALDSVLDQWFYFLKCAGSLTAVPKRFSGQQAIQHAFEIANKAGLNRDELEDQERREMFIHDQRGALDLAKQQGVAEGRAEGAKQMQYNIARSLLATMDDTACAAATGLSISEVQALRAELRS